jgi:hypothetical protein
MPSLQPTIGAVERVVRDDGDRRSRLSGRSLDRHQCRLGRRIADGVLTFGLLWPSLVQSRAANQSQILHTLIHSGTCASQCAVVNRTSAWLAPVVYLFGGSNHDFRRSIRVDYT